MISSHTCATCPCLIRVAAVVQRKILASPWRHELDAFRPDHQSLLRAVGVHLGLGGMNQDLGDLIRTAADGPLPAMTTVSWEAVQRNSATSIGHELRMGAACAGGPGSGNRDRLAHALATAISGVTSAKTSSASAWRALTWKAAEATMRTDIASDGSLIGSACPAAGACMAARRFTNRDDNKGVLFETVSHRRWVPGTSAPTDASAHADLIVNTEASSMQL